MKKLSICIPTYNREEQLAELNRSFLVKVLEKYSNDVDIIIMDQSNDMVSVSNKTKLDPRVIYRQNQDRGYAANVNALLSLVDSEYVWLISDDDNLLWDGFEAIMAELLTSDVDCLMLPIITRNLFDEHYIQDYRFLDKSAALTVNSLLQNQAGHLPFILLSEAVVRFDNKNLAIVYENFKNNIFIQVPMYFSMLELESSVKILNQPVINYVNDYAQQWQLIKLVDDRIAVIKGLSQRFVTFVPYQSQHIAIALWSSITYSVEDEVGILHLNHSKNVRLVLIDRVIRHFKPRSLFMLGVLCLPTCLVVLLYKVIATWLNVKRDVNCVTLKDKFKSFQASYQVLDKTIADRKALFDVQP
jgi:glycosyltransferase involved in cell wall biosynthesis